MLMLQVDSVHILKNNLVLFKSLEISRQSFYLFLNQKMVQQLYFNFSIKWKLLLVLHPIVVQNVLTTTHPRRIESEQPQQKNVFHLLIFFLIPLLQENGR
jgi:hypothetical protein